MAFISERLATAVSVHHGHMPEISIADDSNATGVWAMYDWVDTPTTAARSRASATIANDTGAGPTAIGASVNCG